MKSYQTLSRLECKCKLWGKRRAWVVQYGVTICCSSQARASGSPTGKRSWNIAVRHHMSTLTALVSLFQNCFQSFKHPRFLWLFCFAVKLLTPVHATGTVLLALSWSSWGVLSNWIPESSLLIGCWLSSSSLSLSDQSYKAASLQWNSSKWNNGFYGN